MRERKGARDRPQPPSERSGAEREFLLQAVASGDPLVAQMRDGSRIEGRVLDFDLDSIRFEVDGNEQLFQKSVIRYLREP